MCRSRVNFVFLHWDTNMWLMWNRCSVSVNEWHLYAHLPYSFSNLKQILYVVHVNYCDASMHRPSIIQLKWKKKEEKKKKKRKIVFICISSSLNLGKLIPPFPFFFNSDSLPASPFAFVRNKSKILPVSFEFIILTARHLLAAVPFV